MDKLYGTYRYGKKKKTTFLKRSHKKVSELPEKVKAYVLYLRDLPIEAFQKEIGSHRKEVTKEFFANKFRVKTHEIEQIFMRLNKEGILSQAIRQTAHDTTRDSNNVGWVSTTGWAADTYTIKQPFDRLFDAINQRDEDKITRMLAAGYEINDVDQDDDNALMYAVRIGCDVPFIQFLINNGADPQTALRDVVNSGNIETLKLLLTHVKDPFTQDDKGNDIFFWSCQQCPAFLPILMNYSYSIHRKNQFNQTPLMIAIKSHQLDAATFLLEHGATIKGKDTFHMTAFTYAYKHQDVELLRLFLPFQSQLSKEEQSLFDSIRLQLLFKKDGLL